MNGENVYSSFLLEKSIVPNDDSLFLGGWRFHASLGLEVFNVSGKRIVPFLVTVPEDTVDDRCLLHVCRIAKQPKINSTLHAYALEEQKRLNLIHWQALHSCVM